MARSARWALVPAALLALAGCSDSPEPPAPPTIPAPPVTTPAEPTTADPAPPTTADPAGDMYAEWGTATECPGVDAVNAVLGISLLGEAPSYTAADRHLLCEYGSDAPDSGTFATIEVTSGSGIAPYIEPDPPADPSQSYVMEVREAPELGPTAWYAQIEEGGMNPRMCMVVATGQDAAGNTVNIRAAATSPQSANSAALCDGLASLLQP